MESSSCIELLFIRRENTAAVLDRCPFQFVSRYKARGQVSRKHNLAVVIQEIGRE
jgi:hypothetical protein